MEGLIAVLVVVPLVAAVIAGAHMRRAAFEEAEKAARALGLSLTGGARVAKVDLEGEVDGRPVFARVGSQTLYVRLRRLATPERLAFTAESSAPSVERHRDALARDVEVGDARIDDHWKLDGGNEGVVRALFSRPEVQRYLSVWSRLSLSAQGTLEVRRIPEPGPDVAGDIRRALELAALLEGLADVEPVDAPRAVVALLEARGAAGGSGLPVPVPSFAADKKRGLFNKI